MKTSVRDYKVAIFFLFLGFIASSIVFFSINAHQFWVFKIQNNLDGIKVDIVKLGDRVSGFENWSESWEELKTGMEEALEVIFTKPGRAIIIKPEGK